MTAKVELKGFDFMQLLFTVILRSVLAVIIGGIIGSERGRHGRAAGMRTHILVCLGATLTSMTSMYVSNVLGNNGDVFRISAQVISGVGFLGAGMIILKNNNTITGLTTAAGVWTTGAIGVALGYGFYVGAGIVAVLFLVSIVLLAKFEKRKKATEIIYIEIDDIYKTNEILNRIKQSFKEIFEYQVIPPKSGSQNNMGIIIAFKSTFDFNCNDLLAMDNVVFVVGDF